MVAMQPQGSTVRSDAGSRDLHGPRYQERAGRLIPCGQPDVRGLEPGEVLRRPEADDVGAASSGRQRPVADAAGRVDQMREIVG